MPSCLVASQLLLDLATTILFFVDVIHSFYRLVVTRIWNNIRLSAGLRSVKGLELHH